MFKYEEARETMIRQQLRTTGVLDDEILQVVREVPRDLFVPKAYESVAYADALIPLAHGQQMLLPEAEAQILQALAIQPADQVLEVGTGTGYFTALLAQLAAHVTSVDIFQDFIDTAKQNFYFQKHTNVSWCCADASQGPVDKKIYNVIVISGALHTLPQAFLDALAPGGRLVAILGWSTLMEAVLYVKNSDALLKKHLFETLTPYLVNANTSDRFEF